jgi:hypothetical protein
MLYDNQRTTESLPEQYADVAFVVRDFRADIGGTIVTTPHLNVNRTFNGLSQLGLELGLPYENSSPWCGAPCLGRTNFIPAGSRVRATVEYLVLPADKSRYYGESDHLAAMPAESYRTPEMARAMAAGGALTVEAQQGIVTRIHPVELTAASGGTAAEFTLTGGLGHVPVTVTGLVRHDRWRLERLDGAAWTPVDQSVEGNDFWQARFDDETQRYTLTWNVPNRGTRHYRVRWQP